MKKHSLQAGFAPLLILLGIVILGGIGVAAVKSGAIQKRVAPTNNKPGTSGSGNTTLPQTGTGGKTGNPNTGQPVPQSGTGQTGNSNQTQPPVNTSVQPNNSNFCNLNPAYCSGTAINTQLLCATNPSYCSQYQLYPGLNYIPGYTNSLNQEQLRLQQEWYARQQQNLQLQQQQQLQQQIIQQQMQQNPYQYNPQTNPYSGVPGYPH